MNVGYDCFCNQIAFTWNGGVKIVICDLGLCLRVWLMLVLQYCHSKQWKLIVGEFVNPWEIEFLETITISIFLFKVSIYALKD